MEVAAVEGPVKRLGGLGELRLKTGDAVGDVLDIVASCMAPAPCAPKIER